MTTTELIQALYDLAYECEDMERSKLIREAADRLEELDERVAIMMDGDMDAWDVFEYLTSAYGGKQIFFRQKNGLVYDRYKADYIPFSDALQRFAKLIDDEE